LPLRDLPSSPTRRSSDLAMRICHRALPRAHFGTCDVGRFIATRDVCPSTLYEKLQCSKASNDSRHPNRLDMKSPPQAMPRRTMRSEEHTSELQSPYDLVC